MVTLFAEGPISRAPSPVDAPRASEALIEAESSESPANPEAAEEPSDPVDYELVMGKRQVASVMFVAVVVLVIFSAVSYVAGKSIALRKTPTATSHVTAHVATAAVPAVPLVEATIIQAKGAKPAPPVTPKPLGAVPEASNPQTQPALFADPVPGAIYIQLGALERGISVVMVAGMRSKGFASFVAPGPNDHIFRVLVGPFPNEDAYHQAQTAIDDLGLASFSRRYQQ